MDKDFELLNKIYSGTHIGSRSLNAVLPEVKNSSLRRAILTQICEYDKINSEAKREIYNLGKKAKKQTFTASMASLEAKIQTKANSSPSHIAEMIVKGSSMGIIDITKEINKSHFCKPSAYNLGRRLIKTEEENISRIKGFL